MSPFLACLQVSAQRKSFLSLILFQSIIFLFLVFYLVTALQTYMCKCYIDVCIYFSSISCLRISVAPFHLLQWTPGTHNDQNSGLTLKYSMYKANPGMLLWCILMFKHRQAPGASNIELVYIVLCSIASNNNILHILSV